MPAATLDPTKAPTLASGETPITQPIVEKPRVSKVSLESAFGVPETPEPVKPTAEPPKPPAEPTKPAEKAPESTLEASKPAPEPPKAETPEKPAKDDLDSLLESTKPKKADPAPTETFKEPKQLREAYEKLKADHQRTIDERNKFHVELEDAKSFKDAMEKLKAERDDLANKLAYVSYADSPDYAEKYVKPFQSTAASAIELASKLKHQIEDRPGKDTDIQELFGLFQRDPAAAVERADEIFGSAGRLIMVKVEDMVERNRAMTESVNDWKKTASVRAKEMQVQQENQRKQVLDWWKDQQDREKLARPDIYDFSGDEKLNELHKKAGRFADLAFIPDGNMSSEEWTRHQAKIRMLAAAAVPLTAKLAAKESEVEQLKAALSEYESGRPKVKPTGETPKQPKSNGLAALDDYFRS